MNLTKSKKPLLILLIASTFLIGALLILILYSYKNRQRLEPQPTPVPPIAENIIVPPTVNPETLPQDVKAIRQKIIASAVKDNRGDLLLYQTSSFKIEFIKTPNVFFVTIANDPAESAKREAEAWFISFGLKQQDLCDLPVRFVLGNFEIRRTNPSFTSLPDGCQ